MDVKLLLINLLLIVLSLLGGSLFFFVPYLKVVKVKVLKFFAYDNKHLIYLSIIMAVGFFTRVAFLDLLPGGLNQDEASAAYDAYAIMTTGMDRNGQVMPMHLIAWGSGQNALYSYLMIPFIAIFGVNEIAIRLPMALVGCLSIVLLYDLIRRKYDKNAALFAALFLIIAPWHLMKSRWSLESNLFPDLVFIGFYLFILGLEPGKQWKTYLASALLGLSAYSYGTSYFFLFFFVIGFLVYVFLKKKLKWFEALINLGIIGVISLPIILFLFINIYEKESLQFLWMTIPRLTQNRFESVTNLFSSQFFDTSWTNFTSGISILVTQNDGLPWNSIQAIGTIYFLSLPFVIIGLFNKEPSLKEIVEILRIWLGVSLLMMLIVAPNINRINIVFFPLIIFSFIGLKDVVMALPRLKNIALGSYALYFASFITVYVSSWNDSIKYYFYDSLGEAIRYAQTIENVDTYYVTPNINMPYIYVLLYGEYDVNTFIDTVSYVNPGGAFQHVSAFDHYEFRLPTILSAGNVYIVDKGNTIYRNYNMSAYTVKEFSQYTVISTI